MCRCIKDSMGRSCGVCCSGGETKLLPSVLCCVVLCYVALHCVVLCCVVLCCVLCCVVECCVI